jgi:hypothetical protein
MLALELNDTHNDLHNYIHDDTRTDTQNDTHNGTYNDTHAGVCWHSCACYTSWWSCPGLATGRHRKRHRSQTVDSVKDLSSTLAESTQLYTVCYWSIGIVKHLDQINWNMYYCNKGRGPWQSGKALGMYLVVLYCPHILGMHMHQQCWAVQILHLLL